MKEKYTFEYLEAYLDQGLSTADRAALERDLQNDELLQAELKRHQQTRALVEQMAIEETRSKVGRVFQQQAVRRQSNLRPLLRIAAVIALVLTAGLGYWMTQANPSPGELAANYLEPFPDRLTTMSGEVDELAMAMEAYNKGDFATALSAFEAFPADHPESVLIDLYAGIAALEKGNTTLAENKLARIAGQADYGEVANWYLALVYLQQDEVEKARPLLQELDAADAYRASSARELLQAL